MLKLLTSYLILLGMITLTGCGSEEPSTVKPQDAPKMTPEQKEYFYKKLKEKHPNLNLFKQKKKQQ